MRIGQGLRRFTIRVEYQYNRDNKTTHVPQIRKLVDSHPSSNINIATRYLRRAKENVAAVATRTIHPD